MKLTKKCPECGGTEIYTALSPKSGAEAFNLLPGVNTYYSPVEIELYVCGACGYHRVFVPKEHLHKVKMRFERHEETTVETKIR